MSSVRGWPAPLIRGIIRIALLPVVAGLAYEIIRWAGRHRQSIVARILAAPGMFMQLLTTRRPAADQVEVALYALDAVAVEYSVPTDWPVARRVGIPLPAAPAEPATAATDAPPGDPLT